MSHPISHLVLGTHRHKKGIILRQKHLNKKGGSLAFDKALEKMQGDVKNRHTVGDVTKTQVIKSVSYVITTLRKIAVYIDMTTLGLNKLIGESAEEYQKRIADSPSEVSANTLAKLGDPKPPQLIATYQLATRPADARRQKLDHVSSGLADLIPEEREIVLTSLDDKHHTEKVNKGQEAKFREEKKPLPAREKAEEEKSVITEDVIAKAKALNVRPD